MVTSGAASEEKAAQYTPTRDLTLAALLEEVTLELADPEYIGRTHGSAATYNKGCRGHLCTYRMRTRKREARQAAMLAKLPDGVVPDTRSRQEQYWDSVISYMIEMIDDIREQLARHKRLMSKTLDSIVAQLEPGAEESSK